MAALTFDDGPDPDATPRLLDVLSRHGALATFFMIGERAAQHPELVARVADEGHVIGNHTWSHTVLPRLRGPERRAEIRAAGVALGARGGPWFRPPQGALTIASWVDTALLRQKVVTWSVNGEDWRGYPADRVTEILLRGLHPGGVVLLHDGLHRPKVPEAADRTPTLEAVDRILETLGRRYRFVTVPELLRFGPPERRDWRRGRLPPRPR